MSNIPDVLLLFAILLTHSARHVDFDVTGIPKADMNDANILVLHDMAKRLDALLSKFFVVSIKRSTSLRKVVDDLQDVFLRRLAGCFF